jgi:hypothetical protein
MPDQFNQGEEPMIIGNAASAVRTDVDHTIEHFLNAAKNEYSACIQRTPQDLRDFMNDGKKRGHKYGARLFMVAPYRDMTREFLLTTALPLIARLFGFPASEAVVFEHGLERKGKAASGVHFHFAVSHADPVTGKVRDWGWSNAIVERGSRTLEDMTGEPIQLGRFQTAVIRAMRADGENELADRIEAAHPPGAQPKGRTAKRTIEQPARARGIDLRDLNEIVGTTYNAATNLDALRAGLAVRGLSLEISNRIPDRLAWVIHKNGRFVRSLCGALPRVSLATIVAKIGEPNGPEIRSENEHRSHDRDVGSNLGRVEMAARGNGGADSVRPGPVAADDGVAEEVFVTALNEADIGPFEKLLQRALHSAQSALAQIIEYLARAEAQARRFLVRAADEKPQPDVYVVDLRKKLAELESQRDKARLAWSDAYATAEILINKPRPPRLTEKAHNARLEQAKAHRDTMAAALERAEAAVAAHIKVSGQFEDAYQHAIAEYQATIVTAKIGGARRYLRVIARCRRLIAESIDIVWMGGPALFAHGMAEDERAKPNARWLIEGSDPEAENPQNVPGWKC